MSSNPYVLVTYDNEMVVRHAALLDAYQTTLAVIDRRGWEPSGLTQEEYWREVIHRHAHRFANQPVGTIIKYRCSNRPSRVTLKT